MYDIDGNGSIDQKEMIKIVQGIYDMIGMVICDIKFLREGKKLDRIGPKFVIINRG